MIMELMKSLWVNDSGSRLMGTWSKLPFVMVQLGDDYVIVRGILVILSCPCGHRLQDLIGSL